MDKKVPLLILAGILIIGIFAGLIVSSKMDATSPSFAGSNAKKEIERKDLANVENTGKAFSQIAKEVTPTVVTITSVKKAAEGEGFDKIFNQFHKNIPEQGLGSGVIVREDGYILTNNHVVNESERITVILFDKRALQAKLLGSDPLTDVALIKVDAKGLPVTKFGNSDNLEVGEWVLAVGSPLSLTSTVTAGIVSAMGRGHLDIIGDQYGVENFIQTDAVINPGNSGGALVNIKGELIGINTAIATKTGLYQGYGFAVPVNIARDVMDDIIKYGKAVRGYIGVGIKEVDATYAKAVGLEKAQGVMVESLTNDGAAKESDIHEGDVILEIDGRALNQTNDLQAYVAVKKPGDVVKLLIYANGNKTMKSVTLKSIDGQTTLPTVDVRENDLKENEEEIGNGMGFEVQEISNEGSGTSGKGLVVVNSSWHAKEQEIYEGFILTKVNNKSVSSLEEYQSLIGNFKNGDAVVIQLVHAQSRQAKIITAIEVKKKK